MSTSRFLRQPIRCTARLAVDPTSRTHWVVASSRAASSTSKTDAKPKILDHSPPDESQQSEDTRKHNEELDRRPHKEADKGTAVEQEQDKVDSKFWSGDRAGKSDDHK